MKRIISFIGSFLTLCVVTLHGDENLLGLKALQNALTSKNSNEMRLFVSKVCAQNVDKRVVTLNAILSALMNEIDPAFDLAKPPQINLATPSGTWASAGSAPASIKDEKKKAEYEAELKANKAYAERFAFNDLLCRQCKMVLETIDVERNGKAASLSSSTIKTFFEREENRVTLKDDKILTAFIRWFESN